MRKTFLDTPDKRYLIKAAWSSALAYLLFIVHIIFETFWVKEVVGIFHDETHDSNILIAMIINFIVGLTVLCLAIISIAYSKFYLLETAAKDRLKPLNLFSLILAWSILFMDIIFVYLNVLHLLYIL